MASRGCGSVDDGELMGKAGGDGGGISVVATGGWAQRSASSFQQEMRDFREFRVRKLRAQNKSLTANSYTK